MNKYLLLASAVFFVMIAADRGTAQGDKKDKKGLQGTWNVVTYGAGVEAKSPDIKGKVVIKGDKLTQLIAFVNLKAVNNLEGTFKLDADKTPKAIDLDVAWFELPGSGKVEKKRKMVGIYELTGDDLKIALSDGEKRPTDFAIRKDAKEGEEVVVLILKRAN